jgi:hypothetical protein
MDKKIGLWPLLCFSLLANAQQKDSLWKNDDFTVQPATNGVAGIWKTGDRYPTNYVRKGRVFGDVVVHASDTSQQLVHTRWELKGQKLLWTISLRNPGAHPVTIEDLALPLPYNSGGGENPTEIFEQRVVKHHFISGNNSFIFWERPTGVGPYLLMLPTQGTSLEYFATGTGENRGAFQVFIHSAHAVTTKTGSWRQPNTKLILKAGEQKQYHFVFRWANNYQELRDIIVDEGGIDVRVTPGMTVPNDLDATLALRTRRKIGSISAEFPAATTISAERQLHPGTRLYKIHFSRLGENRLTIDYGEGERTYLEFFVTEPLETLYKKRAAFIVDHQQHKDRTKWYDGLFSIYDMKHHVLRGPDNPDYFDTSRLSYVLTCDDPALDKAPFVAAKNLYYPNPHEIDGLEYYIRHYVWGGLQRTDKETPYPYGVYGTPNWKVNRDTALRKRNANDRNKDKMHVWRSYDYPHIVMLYYHLYQIAKRYPGMTHYLDAKGYLERAKETAKAFFLYPYEILPWYETYKWGCYNELLLVPLMRDLEKEGFAKDAAFLRSEWEKKVKYFIYDDPYPFRSEYAIDATAFESTEALAKYALLHTLQPDSNLWFDKNLKRWYSHPHIDKADAKNFMDRQMAANIALRGSIEPAYYYLGSDYRGRSDNFTLTYMTQMGGWSILDYGLHFAADPAEYLRLGYAAYLAPFALMNTGTAASGYGFWYPGKDNDGASGWAFESQQHTNTWIQKVQDRGPWYYDGEVDLGYGGATRSAATILTKDPVFGWTALGGTLSMQDHRMAVIPRDGLRTRFFYRNGADGFDLELDRDGFAKDKPILIATPDGGISFAIENRSGDTHITTITLTKHESSNPPAKGEPSNALKKGGSAKNVEVTVKPGAPTNVRLD